MAEENTQTISPEAQSKLDAIGGFLNRETQQELSNAFSGKEQPKEKNATEEVKSDVKGEEVKAEAPKTSMQQMEDFQKDVNLGPQEQDQITIKSDLMGEKTIGGTKKQDIKVESDDAKALQDYILKSTGLDGLDKFEGAVNGWRKDAQGKAEAERARQEAENLFQSLPTQIQNAIVQYNSGEDWLSSFKKTGNLDYEKNPSDYSKKDLINSYFPGKFSDEDWKDYNAGEEEHSHLIGRINDAYDTAKEKFSSTKSTIKETRANYQREAEKQLKAYNDSVPRSEQHFNQTFPEASPSVLDRYKKFFSDGGVNQLFFNNDGSLKEDAFVKVAMAEDGKGLLDQYIAAAEKAAVNNHIEKELAESKSSIRSSGGSGAGKGSVQQTDAQKAAAKIENIFGPMSTTFKY